MVEWTRQLKMSVAACFGLSIEIILLAIFFVHFAPNSIPIDVARPIFEKIIDVDTALLGFTGVIVAVSMQNWKEKYWEFLAVLLIVVSFFLVSLVACFFGELDGGITVAVTSLFLPLAFAFEATTILFYGLALVYSANIRKA